MSARLSAVLPRACSGDMYAAVPSRTPAPVISAGLVIVGDIDAAIVGAIELPAAASRQLDRRRVSRRRQLGESEVQHLHDAVGRDLDVGGLQVAVDDALLVRGFERGGNLPRDGQRLGDGNRPARDPLGERLALDELQHQRAHARVAVPSSNP